MKLLVPASAPLELSPPPAGVQVVTYEEGRPLPAEHLDADAIVVVGQKSAGLEQLKEMPRLRWVQSLAAGPDALLALGLPERVTVTVGRGFHDKTVSETAVALILALTTKLPHYGALQREKTWAGPGWRPLHSDGPLDSIIGAEVLIWGFGSIGSHLAPILRSLGATVRGVARTGGVRDGFEVFTEADLPRLLPATDLLVMILPGGEATRQALNAERIALLRPSALVVNVGRGTAIDEDALAEALHAGRLGGAGLDVAAVEPLPASSSLWDAPNTIITPHIAGGRPLGVEEAVRANLDRFLAGEPLDLQVR